MGDLVSTAACGRDIYIESDAAVVRRALVHALTALGWNARELTYRASPVGEPLSAFWPFAHAWPLCDWPAVGERVLVWVAVSTIAAEEALLAPLRLSLLRRLRGAARGTRLVAMVPNLPPGRAAALHRLGFETVTSRLVDLLVGLAGEPPRATPELAVALAEQYRATLANLAHRIKDGPAVLGLAARQNNHRLLAALFATLTEDLMALGLKEDADLCRASLELVNSVGMGPPPDDLMERWRAYSGQCAGSRAAVLGALRREA